MPTNSAETHLSEDPVLIQSALLTGRLMADTAPGIPLSLLLSAPALWPVNMTDAREARDRHDGAAVALQHP